MNAYKSRIVVAVGAAAAGLCLVFIPTASSGGQAPFVHEHRHFIESPNGTRIPIGPQVCGRPGLQTAFNQFHANIHVGQVGLVAMNHAHNPVAIKAGPC
ncbi:MAG TPA: hypothetical protein VLI04_05440 [Nocardioidaceae bacterium]|nr:hypothetical protein [Nocardioidaceae bacterium]